MGPCELALSPVAAAFRVTSSDGTAVLGVEEAAMIRSDSGETDSELLSVAGVESLLACVNGEVK